MRIARSSANHHSLLNILFIFTACMLCTIHVHAQSDLKQGWDNFAKNDISRSRDYFTRATSSEKDKAEAYLMLAVLATIDKTNEEAFVNFEKFYESAPDPIPYLDALLTTDIAVDGYGRKTKEQLEFFKKLLKDPRITGTLIDNIHSILGSHYQSSQEDKKSLEEYAQIKTIDKWQIVGTFDNISASGFDKDYGPVKFPKKEDGFKGNYNAPIN